MGQLAQVEAEGRGGPSAGIVHPVGGLVGARSEEREAHVVGTLSVRNPGDSEALRVNWATLVGVGTAGTVALTRAAELEEAWGDFDEAGLPAVVEQGLDNLLGRESYLYHPYVPPGHKRDVLDVVASHGGRNGERLRGSVRVNVEVEGHERVFMVPLDVVFERGCGGASVEPVLLGPICGGCPVGTLSGRGAGAGTAALVVRNAAVAGAVLLVVVAVTRRAVRSRTAERAKTGKDHRTIAIKKQRESLAKTAASKKCAKEDAPARCTTRGWRHSPHLAPLPSKPASAATATARRV